MKNFYYLCYLIIVIYSPFTKAHSLHLFAQYNDNQLSGNAYYSDNSPASGHYLAIYQADKLILEGITDSSGKFNYPLTLTPPITLVVEGEEGHKASTIIQQTQAVTEQTNLLLLREDIHQLTNKLFWRDVLGGIGYILGIFGLWALFYAKRSIKANKE